MRPGGVDGAQYPRAIFDRRGRDARGSVRRPGSSGLAGRSRCTCLDLRGRHPALDRGSDLDQPRHDPDGRAQGRGGPGGQAAAGPRRRGARRPSRGADQRRGRDPLGSLRGRSRLLHPPLPHRGAADVPATRPQGRAADRSDGAALGRHRRGLAHRPRLAGQLHVVLRLSLCLAGRGRRCAHAPLAAAAIRYRQAPESHRQGGAATGACGLGADARARSHRRWPSRALHRPARQLLGEGQRRGCLGKARPRPRQPAGWPPEDPDCGHHQGDRLYGARRLRLH